jgi:hypothetical protein
MVTELLGYKLLFAQIQTIFGLKLWFSNGYRNTKFSQITRFRNLLVLNSVAKNYINVNN